jgi:hypothetical protein
MGEPSVVTMRVRHLVVPLLLSATVPLSAQTATPSWSPPQHHSLLHVLAFAAGGSVLGAWAGYVTSQVIRSDWQDTTGRSTQRLRFSAGGATLGLAAGLILGTRGSQPATPLSPPHLPAPIAAPITEDEIRGSAALTIVDLLRERRPQWLRARGIETINANSSLHAPHGVVVYLNGTPFGDLSSLDEISIYAVTGISFLEGPAAVVRYGTGNEDGAILLTTAAAP